MLRVRVPPHLRSQVGVLRSQLRNGLAEGRVLRFEAPKQADGLAASGVRNRIAFRFPGNMRQVNRRHHARSLDIHHQRQPLGAFPVSARRPHKKYCTDNMSI